MNIQVKGKLSMFYHLILLKLSIIIFTTDINCNRCIKIRPLKTYDSSDYLIIKLLYNYKINEIK